MYTEYSKPSADIRKESTARLKNEKEAFERQRQTQDGEKGFPKRRTCIVCARTLKGDDFLHRGQLFVVCGECGHLQSALSPPSSAPAVGFHTIYPNLSAKQYAERKERIYAPKLRWIARSLNKLGLSSRELKKRTWMEIGAGAGYFLSALNDYGAKHFAGFDSNEQLVAVANRALKSDRVRHETEPDLSKAIRGYTADIYVAFFVLEHLENAHTFLQQVKLMPKGTIFIFAVPVFGLSVLLDGVFEGNFARQLDGIVHRQLYTDESIQYAAELAGLQVVAEWVFGQDADDLTRFLLQNLEKRYSPGWFRRVSMQLVSAQDAIQEALDRTRLGDQRHVVGIRR